MFDNYYKDITFKGVNASMGLWDTAGQEEYDRLRVLSYNDTDLVIVTFSIADPDSFDNVSSKWIPEIKYHMKDSFIFLVGCKLDLRKDPITLNRLSNKNQVPITTSQGKRKAREIGADSYIELSALTGTNIENLFDQVLSSTLTRSHAFGNPGNGCCTIA